MRSSASAQDLPGSAFADRQDTILNVVFTGDPVTVNPVTGARDRIVVEASRRPVHRAGRHRRRARGTPHRS
ncbi:MULTISPECIES: hypothetical protein [Nonomuraea]|uniref:Uncharacterized protein n=1 Tax=Nonomuraea mangrovi TaxID=2316207 RepID=A0ABW4SS38_9ACTN